MRIYPEGWVPYAREPILGQASVLNVIDEFSKQTAKPQAGVCGLSLKSIYRKVNLFMKLLACRVCDTESERCQSAELLGFSTIDLNAVFQEVRAGPSLVRRAEALISFIYPHARAIQQWILCGTTRKCWGINISD